MGSFPIHSPYILLVSSCALTRLAGQFSAVEVSCLGFGFSGFEVRCFFCFELGFWGRAFGTRSKYWGLGFLIWRKAWNCGLVHDFGFGAEGAGLIGK